VVIEESKMTIDRTYAATRLLAMFAPDTLTATIASAFGVSRSTVQKWSYRQVRLSAFDADRYAIAIGLHPAEVWDNWFTITTDKGEE
jgi:hypothetical protein